MGVNILQNRRRMIMAAQPHLETVSGGVANFTADMALPLKECKVTFLPKQSGSGDPSPENVRPISGWDGLSVFVSPTTTGGTEYPVTWQSAGTVYGGSVDLTTGDVWGTHKLLTLTGNEGYVWSIYRGSAYTVNGLLSDSRQGTYIYGLCNSIKQTGSAIASVYLKKSYSDSGLQFYDVGTYWGIEDVSSNSFNAMLQEMNNAGNPFEICYELETPVILATLTPQQITTFIGTNNIWSDAGDVELTYWSNR